MTIDLQILQEKVDQKLLNVQRHASAPLYLWNYSRSCMFDRKWDDMTIMCRGLITDDMGHIIARPFPKFFNLEEHQNPDLGLPKVKWNQSYTITKKFDGSLGILYAVPEEGKDPVDCFHIATRSRFDSPHTRKAREIFYARGYNKFPYDLEEFTFLFEVIFPSNRIVVDYGTMEDLILLDVIESETGKSLSRESVEHIANAIGCPYAERINLIPQLPGAIPMFQPSSNEEGYVVHFADGTRIKIKFEEYVRLHSLLTGVTTRKIWANLMFGSGIEKLLENVPDEFNEWVRKHIGEITGKYDELEIRAIRTFTDIEEMLQEKQATADGREPDQMYDAGAYPIPRRDYAMEFVKHPDIVSILFHMLDKKDYQKLLWQKVKPATSSPFHAEIDV